MVFLLPDWCFIKETHFVININVVSIQIFLNFNQFLKTKLRITVVKTEWNWNKEHYYPMNEDLVSVIFCLSHRQMHKIDHKTAIFLWNMFPIKVKSAMKCDDINVQISFLYAFICESKKYNCIIKTKTYIAFDRKVNTLPLFSVPRSYFVRLHI